MMLEVWRQIKINWLLFKETCATHLRVKIIKLPLSENKKKNNINGKQLIYCLFTTVYAVNKQYINGNVY